MTDADEAGRGRDVPGSDPERSLRERVVEQFSDAGERAAIWRGFERFLPTRRYLNLGYSPWYLPHVVGSSQARLAAHLADGVAERLGDPAGARLLDLGCGRGGPALQFAGRGFDVTGLDLVPYNAERARENAAWSASRPAFVVGDATALPFVDGAFDACVAVDSLVYLPAEGTAFDEARRVLDDGGWLAVADLLAADDVGPDGRDALAAFADAWDLAPVVGAGAFRDRLRAAGFAVETVEDVTPNSTGRFRKWSRCFLALADGPAGGALRALLRRWNVDPGAVVAQVRAAHRALPYLRHEVVYARG